MALSSFQPDHAKVHAGPPPFLQSLFSDSLYAHAFDPGAADNTYLEVLET